MVNFGPLAAEIVSLVWGTSGNFNGFRVLAPLLHGTPVVDVSQTLWHWIEGATYIWQGGHHVGPHSSLVTVQNCKVEIETVMDADFDIVVFDVSFTKATLSSFWCNVMPCNLFKNSKRMQSTFNGLWVAMPTPLHQQRISLARQALPLICYILCQGSSWFVPRVAFTALETTNVIITLRSCVCWNLIHEMFDPLALVS